MKRVLIILFTIILLGMSCKKDIPPVYNNIIRIDSMCTDNKSYIVHFNVVSYNTEYKIYAMTFNLRDTLDYKLVQGGGGTHTVTLSTKESGCAGIFIRIINGPNSETALGNCKPCNNK